jgi:hypothetical protein
MARFSFVGRRAYVERNRGFLLAVQGDPLLHVSVESRRRQVPQMVGITGAPLPPSSVRDSPRSSLGSAWRGNGGRGPRSNAGRRQRRGISGRPGSAACWAGALIRASKVARPVVSLSGRRFVFFGRPSACTPARGRP